MKLNVIACGVLELELTKLADQSPNEIHLHFLDAGLHATPDLLRKQAQEHIDAAVGRGFDAVVLGYGLCGRGTSGLIARDAPVVIPRVHDCITLFLGSREEYRRQFARHPGTFYTTPGWYEKTSVGERRPGRGGGKKADARQDPRFPDLAEKFGETNAEDIIRFHDSWKRNYTRAAFIDTGVGAAERYQQHTREMADEFGWTFERLQGDTSLLDALLAGEWDDRALVLEPGQRSTLTGDERIFAAIDVAAGPAPTSEPRPETKPQAPPCDARPEPSEGARIGLGIDAGGTYTDCVLYDLRVGKTLAKSKALTTHHDLMVGIGEALDRVAIPDPGEIELVALSTTLATNSIVEDKGGTPGAIIMSSAPGMTDAIRWKPLRMIGGEMGIDGYEIRPPDREEIARAVDELLAAGVDAFAISGYAAVKNPAHEALVRDVVLERCDLPVVCGHELSSRLNYVSRANTAILNSRLLPVVRELMGSARQALTERGVRGALMVVKGDGSLINEATALARPIETILSGPAASVSGARHLTGLADAIVLDMGGTTTDTAIIENGVARISPDGARVGGWLTSVEAADMSTTGLGGDSYLDFTGDRKLLIGPRRVIPLAYLCHRHPDAARLLAEIDPDAQSDRSTPAVLDFFVLARTDHNGLPTQRERQVIEALRDGPLPRRVLAARARATSPRLLATKRLEELGIVQRSALTPTDILHVTGEFRAWDVGAAEQGLAVFAGILGIPPAEVIRRVRQGITERLAGQIITKEIPEACGEDPEEWPKLLRTAFDGGQEERLRAELKYDRPIIAIGAPVRPFFPPVSECLNAEVIIPEHADVANAIGAIASEVVVRERAVIRPGEIADYVVYVRSGRTEYRELGEAIAAAKATTAALAQQRARDSGTAARDVKHTVDERRAFSAEGERVLVEVVVEGTVSGRPEV